MKFKVGDRITGTDKFESLWDITNEIGTVVSIEEGNYIIKFDNDIGGWGDFCLDIKDGHGLRVGEQDIKLLKQRGFEVICDEKRKHPDVEIQLPTRGSKHAIAYDIYSPIDTVIQPMEKELIWTDVKAYFQTNEALLINVRSSMGSHPITVANAQGWIECDYYNNPKNDGNLGVNLLT